MNSLTNKNLIKVLKSKTLEKDLLSSKIDLSLQSNRNELSRRYSQVFQPQSRVPNWKTFSVYLKVKTPVEEHFHKVYRSKTETNFDVYYLLSAETWQFSKKSIWRTSFIIFPIVYQYFSVVYQFCPDAMMQRTKQVGIFVNFSCRYTKHVYILWHWLHTRLTHRLVLKPVYQIDRNNRLK